MLNVEWNPTKHSVFVLLVYRVTQKIIALRLVAEQILIVHSMKSVTEELDLKQESVKDYVLEIHVLLVHHAELKAIERFVPVIHQDREMDTPNAENLHPDNQNLSVEWMLIVHLEWLVLMRNAKTHAG